jgi:hypothetical protein
VTDDTLRALLTQREELRERLRALSRVIHKLQQADWKEANYARLRDLRLAFRFRRRRVPARHPSSGDVKKESPRG